MLAAMLLLAGACSKDDEPGDYENTADGVTIYLNAIEKLYDKDGQPMYSKTATADLYIAVAASRDIADSFVADLVGNPDWNGRDIDISLGENGESGSLKVESQQLPSGVYARIKVNIDGDLENYPPYTLEIVSADKAREYGVSDPAQI